MQPLYTPDSYRDQVEASTEMAMGPTVATAVSRSMALLDVSFTNPVTLVTGGVVVVLKMQGESLPAWDCPAQTRAQTRGGADHARVTRTSSAQKQFG